ncbi:hypothetical protein Y032_0015g2517 [Ancylostoma ceylanicum]|uniref:MULE transposase domain-containing protein n=1 Tax=Ancylostoma ceylanicum TaxID=53326 RepID=A0A016V7E8_9BILA|nr:hypothetical protein Y032_0015g2517 [Ancylostoma ceylanicum]
MCYRIPGTDETYTFIFKRISKDHQLYQCQQCKSKGKWTGITMIGNQFFTDPCTMDHLPECNPIKTAHNLVDRTLYEFSCGVQYDISYARATPKQVWHEQMATVKKAAQARALKTHKSDETFANMYHIPDSLSRLLDGSMFVHRLEPTLHVYYNSNTVQMTARSGLYALVADGFIHSNLVYTTIFRHVRDEFVASVFPANLRVVLDFGKASISAVKRLFPDATVKGCAFHLAQTWIRRRDRVGLLPFLSAARKSFEVETWWQTIKASGIPTVRRVPKVLGGDMVHRHVC